MKLILVVDPHVTKQNLEESAKLLPWIREIKDKYKADRIIFLGDQYDDFGIVHTEVMNFWLEQFSLHAWEDIALIGNHDEDAKGATSAMSAHAKQVTVVGKKPFIIDNCAFIGYIRSNDLFIQTVNELPTYINIVFCHAEFDGAQFEGGFFTKHGIDLKQMRSDLIFVSGHIHKQSQFANVFYGGTARWSIRSDANVPKGIWYMDTVTGHKEMIPTPKEIALPYIKITVTEGMDFSGLLKTIPLSGRTYLDFQGSQSFIDESFALLAKLGLHDIKTRSFPDREGQVRIVSEAEGLSQAFYKYAKHFLDANNVDPIIAEQVLLKLTQAVGEL